MHLSCFLVADPTVLLLLCNTRQMTGRFGDVTQTAFGFWLYDLCDTYLELIKPIVGDKSEGNKKVRTKFFFFFCKC